MAMTGNSTTVAPNAARLSTNEEACARVRVTTTLRPANDPDGVTVDPTFTITRRARPPGR